MSEREKALEEALQQVLSTAGAVDWVYVASTGRAPLVPTCEAIGEAVVAARAALSAPQDVPPERARFRMAEWGKLTEAEKATVVKWLAIEAQAPASPPAGAAEPHAGAGWSLDKVDANAIRLLAEKMKTPRAYAGLVHLAAQIQARAAPPREEGTGEGKEEGEP